MQKVVKNFTAKFLSTNTQNQLNRAFSLIWLHIQLKNELKINENLRNYFRNSGSLAK